MVQRATDAETAREVLVADELARCGASAALIERLTGFGSRWVRRTVRRNGGAMACKPQDPLRWFERDPERLLHARSVVLTFINQPANRSPGRRLLDAYLSYRALAPQPGSLEINKCAEITELYRNQSVWMRMCSECRLTHLVLSEHALCPVCRLIAREFCRGCRAPLPARSNPARAYCDQCTPRAARLARKRLPKRPLSVPRPVNVTPASRAEIARSLSTVPSRRQHEMPAVKQRELHTAY